MPVRAGDEGEKHALASAEPKGEVLGVANAQTAVLEFDGESVRESSAVVNDCMEASMSLQVFEAQN